MNRRKIFHHGGHGEHTEGRENVFLISALRVLRALRGESCSICDLYYMIFPLKKSRMLQNGGSYGFP